MRTSLIFFSLTMFMNSCCSYDNKDLDFNVSDLQHFSFYQTGDTLYFESNKNDVDTISIIGFDTEINRNCGGLMAPKPGNSKCVRIKHLPIDRWHGTTQSGNTKTIDYQELFWISKDPIEKKIEYWANFKDFHSTFDTSIGIYHTDTITINDMVFTNYYVINHGHPEKINKPENIKSIIWTDKYGLTAYENNNNEVWTIKLEKSIR